MCTVWITGVICFGHIVSVIKTSLFGVPRLSANLLWPWPLGFRLGNTKLTIQVSPKSWVTDGAMKTLDCEVYSESNAAPKVQRAGQKKNQDCLVPSIIIIHGPQSRGGCEEFWAPWMDMTMSPDSMEHMNIFLHTVPDRISTTRNVSKEYCTVTL